MDVRTAIAACAALESQLGKAEVAEPKHPKLALAKELGSDWTKLCQAKSTKQGVEKLREALYALGVRPSA